MSAPLAAVVDSTPLYGDEVDASARIGWILRTARLTAGKRTFPRLEDMAATTGRGVTALHRFETGRLTNAQVAREYERALGLPRDSLSSPIDTFARLFPDRLRHRRESSHEHTVTELSVLSEALTDTPHPTGHQWLSWARALTEPDVRGFPRRLAFPLLYRLGSELGRAQGHSHATRHEALHLLLCSHYGELALEAARDLLSDPDHQTSLAVLNVVAEEPSPQAALWIANLLREGSRHLVVPAAGALGKMSCLSGANDFWDDIIDPVTDAYDQVTTGTWQWHAMSHLLRQVPASQRRRLTDWKPPHPMAEPLPAEAIAVDTAGPVWEDCWERARTISRALEIPMQPMLARILFDIAYSSDDLRAQTTLALTGALPQVAHHVADQLIDLACGAASEPVTARVRLRLTCSRTGQAPPAMIGMLDHHNHQNRDVALLLVGSAGVTLPQRPVDAAIDQGGVSAAAALYGLGMAGDPRLGDIAAQESAAPDVRAIGRWWLRTGPRVVDPGTPWD